MELLSPLIFSLTLIVSLLIAILFFLTRNPSKPANPGSVTELIKNSHRILDWTTDLLSSSPTSTISTAMGIITADPVTVEHTLKTRFDSYVKGDHSHDILFDLLGGGIFNSDGDSWKLQRRTASLEFSTKTIRTFVIANVRFEVLNRLLPFLSSAAAGRTSFDLQELLERFAFDNVCKVVFNEDTAQLGEDNERSEGRRFYRAFDQACNICVERFKAVVPISWKLRRMFGLGLEGQLKKNIKIVDEYAMRVVKSRRQAVLSDDLLSRFIAEKV